MAGGKEAALRKLGKEMAANGAPVATVEAIDAAANAFGEARREHRNAISHAGALRGGETSDGSMISALSLQSNNLGPRVIRAASDLLAEAHRIEDAINPIERAREMVRSHYSPPS